MMWKEAAMSRIWGVVVLAVLALPGGFGGCSEVGIQSSPSYGTVGSPPVIEAVYAAPAIAAGDAWRIYVKAHDSEGNIRDIQTWMQASKGSSTPASTTVSDDQATDLSGYLVLNTLQLPPAVQTFAGSFRVFVAVVDRANNRSAVQVLSVSFQAGTVPQPPPPAGLFADRLLGGVPTYTFSIDSGFHG